MEYKCWIYFALYIDCTKLTHNVGFQRLCLFLKVYRRLLTLRWQTKGSRAKPDYLCIWFKVTVCLYWRSAFAFSLFEILLDWDVT